MTQYLKSGGRPLEIAQILNKVDKDELFHISYVFSAIHLILMEKMKKSTDLTKETDAIELCSYLLNNHRALIEKLLASNYATHKKAVLRVLTDAVYLAPHLGRELLTTFNVVFNAETLTRFTAHEQKESHLPDEERVRTCYIYFILAYIIEGNHILIKNLLDRNELLMAMVSGLVYDSQKTVVLVLKSFLKFVLQSESVSKTKKVQVFGINIVKELLRLFEWKGSAYFATITNKKLKGKVDLEQYINNDELQIVCDTAHQFLCELLASRKVGIAFKCLGQRKTKYNGVQKKILLMIDNFWEHPQKADLIIEILKACPELTKHFVQKHASRLDPFKKNNNWSAMADFFAKMVDEMIPQIIEYQVDKMNVKETIDLIKEICMPAEILQQLRSKHTLKNRNVSIRMKSTKILYLMFKQCNQYLFNLTKWNVYRTNEVKKIKFELINHILLLCPPVESILLSLHLSQVDDSLDSLQMFEHLECILDLLLIITKSIPSFIDATASVINYIKILGPIYELNREHESSTRIEFKAVKLMLALEPKALSPKTELFEQIIQSFFNVYRFGTPNDQIEAKHLLRNVFHNTGHFENGPLEVDLWLAALNHVDEDSLTTIKDFIVKQINSYDVTNTQIAQIQPTKADVPSKNITEMFENIEKGATLKGILDVATLRPFFLYTVQSLKELTDAEDENAEEIQQYIEMVAFYLFHYLPMPEAVYFAMEPISHQFSSYMKKWIAQSKCGKLPKEFPSNFLNNFYTSLVGDDKESFTKVFESELTIASDSNEENEDKIVVNLDGTDYIISTSLANETQIMICIYTMMFVTNQQHKNRSLNAEQCTHVVGFFTQFTKILNAISTKNAEIINFGFELNESETNINAKALTYLFKNCFYLLQSFDIWSKDNQMTRLVYEMIKSVEHTEHLNDVLVHYRKKISNQISTAVQNLKDSSHSMEPCENLIDLLTTFRLDVDDCSEILNSLAQLDHKCFVTLQNETSIFASILAYALQRMAELKERPLNSSDIASIALIYADLVRKISVEINYQIIEEALVVYLTFYYHSIAEIQDDFFNAIFDVKRLNKAVVKLACLLLDRKPSLMEHLPSLLEKNMPKKELIYPLINVCAVRGMAFDEQLLTTLYGEYKNGILKTIEKPNKAAVIYKENVLSSIFLIEKCMPVNECVDFLRKTFNYESAEVYQLQIIKSIHLKIIMKCDKVETIEQAYENFLLICIRLLSTLLKHEPLDMPKINAFAYIAYDWTKFKLKLLPEAMSAKLKYENIRGSQLWLQFGKSCLKHGLKLQYDSANKAQDGAAILLKLFAYLCNEFYRNDKNDEDIKNFFEMTVTHSNFFDIITLQQQKSVLKTNVAYLLYVFVRKNSEVIEPNHLPVFLSGYQAKMSNCDQYILAILQMYEKNGCNTHKYRPFMFGESALSHYSLSSSAVVKQTLLQEPPIMQVLALIDRDVAENTLINFPVWRHLNAINQVPDVEFNMHGVAGEEHSNNVSIAKSNIEKLVESDGKADSSILMESARRDETYDDVYDPAFLIPLMQMAFAPETLTKPVRPAQNGLLAVTFACLSSDDKEMRLAAAAALQRYRNHLETARFVDSKLWFHLFDGIKNGISNLTVETQKHKKNRVPRISYIAGVFFARVINTLVNPLSEIYRPLSTFLLIKNTFNFQTVPEFNVL